MVPFKQDGIPILWWNKEITLQNIDDFRLSLWKLFDCDEPELILDLQGVAYLNSSALGVLAEVGVQSRWHRKKLVISGIEPAVENIFNIVKFGTFLRLFKHRSDAIVYVQASKQPIMKAR